MDDEDVQLMEMAARVWSRADEGIASVLRQYVFEHRFDMKHVVKFYGAFTGGRRCKGDVYEVFENYFVQERMYDEVLELYKGWMDAMKKEYEFEESMRFFRCFERMYEQGVCMMREKMNENAVVVLLDLCRLLGSNAAEYECYVVSRRISEVLLQMGMPAWAMTEYLDVLSEIFIESNMLFSYVNVVGMLVSLDANAMSKQSSLDDFRLICRYAGMKNEGEIHRKCFGKMKCIDVFEVLGNVERRCAGIECVKDTLVRRRFNFGMWSRYADCVLNAVCADENIDLIVFMKKNDLGFEIDGGKVKADGYEYRSVERKVFEICEEYREKVEDAKMPEEERRIPRRIEEVGSAYGRAEACGQKNEIRFRDRFSGVYKKMRVYLRYYMDKAEGIDDVWYEERDMAMRRMFEENENEQRRSREKLKKHAECIERLSVMLSSRIEEEKRSEEVQNRRSEEVSASGKVRVSNWRSEPDEKPKAYVPPSVDSYSMNKRQERKEEKSISELRQPRMQGEPDVKRNESQLERGRRVRGGDWMNEPRKSENTNCRNRTD
ncbi:hypothetical protein HK407_03g05250 [Ordospora pajunii]|uniref:uncharacterized protein n=1 Tax=Ordospora pajunii TaxID=3039483 RepID=UPI00295270F9|nr:uncharacterized protein HK407_03g05250 [Ordospora pajunii]KAH9411775.1 hypothetical protein HK407_03g05250 [Ordospora pajunii]